ncbi:MAG TPA: M23 family metallopeptidase [Frankiaceae bacterium]|nr:M23 family metallopeptidase [Frankiaceae bacterium]
MARSLAVLAALAIAATLLVAPAPEAFAGTTSAPVWFPLRHNVNGDPIKVGCTYQSFGSQGGYDCGGYHPWWALDLMAPVGTPVYAAGAGQLTVVRSGNTGCSSTSNSVMINHGSGVYSYYTHLASITVSNGTWVTQNTRIATVGQTGLAGEGCAPHLHYEKRTGTTQSTAVSPGELKACRGATLTSYPRAWGLSTWQGIAWGTRYAYSDGTNCGAIPMKKPGEWNRYYNGSDHSALTGSPLAGYRLESTLGSLLASQAGGTVPIYSCNIGTDEFSSLQSNCEGQRVNGRLGFIYPAQPSGVVTRAIYRCRTGSGEHFNSPAATCEGQRTEHRLGYVISLV